MRFPKYLFHPACSAMPIIPEEEFVGLVQSIRERGLIHPIVLHEGKILDGRNRYLACSEAHVEPRFVEWKGEGSPWAYAWDTNAARRHLEPGQRAALRLVYEQEIGAWRALQEKAAARMNSGRPTKIRDPRVPGPEGGSTRPKHETPSIPIAKPPRPRDVLAASAAVSPGTAQRAISLQQKNPAAFARVVAGTTPLKTALAEVQIEKKRAMAAELDVAPMPAPSGPYHVIVIDPPWRYDARAEDPTHRGRNQYPDMSIEQICDEARVPVRAMAEKNCILWLWVTNAFMREAYTCLDAWGFTAKTILTWDKELIGVGHWLRNSTEHCILATKGSPIVRLTNQSTLIREKRREHSRKPDAFFALVEQLCPGTKLEMFARTARPGWAAWGAETGKFQ